MGSMPNCQKEIPAHHAIRWFKCKLKPPKNYWQGGSRRQPWKETLKDKRILIENRNKTFQ